MRVINSLDDLSLPQRHRAFLEAYLNNISTFKCIDRVILFGSCAKGTATERSDIDIFIITKYEIPEELEFSIIFDSVPDQATGYVESDILLKSVNNYEKYKNDTGMVQKAIEREGIDLSGLLPVSI